MYDEDYYNRKGLIETPFEEAGLLRPEQASAVAYAFAYGRSPRRVLSVGCGTGIMEQFLETLGISVIGVDSSQAAQKLYKGLHFKCSSFVDAVINEEYDTVILCAAIEHIALEEITEAFEILRRKNVRVIITNRLDYHPIAPNRFDHITRIDDNFFTTISRDGTVVFKEGSHCIVDFNGGGT